MSCETGATAVVVIPIRKTRLRYLPKLFPLHPTNQRIFSLFVANKENNFV
jgi:uncharacterized membrane protein (GlpM family)